MSLKISDNDLVTLTLNKPAFVGMCSLDLSKVLIQEFVYDYIKNKFDSNLTLSFTDTDMYEIKTEDFNEAFSKDRKILDYSNYSAESKYYNDSKKLVVAKMKYEKGGVANKEFVGFKWKMYSFLVHDNSEHKKAKSMNKNVLATIIHNEYNNVLSNVLDTQ